jgi:hypothetical protein
MNFYYISFSSFCSIDVVLMKARRTMKKSGKEWENVEKNSLSVLSFYIAIDGFIHLVGGSFVVNLHSFVQMQNRFFLLSLLSWLPTKRSINVVKYFNEITATDKDCM